MDLKLILVLFYICFNVYPNMNVFVKMLSGEVHTISIWNGFTMSDLCLKVKDILQVNLCDVDLNFFDKNFERISYVDYEDDNFLVSGDLFYVLVSNPWE